VHRIGPTEQIVRTGVRVLHVVDHVVDHVLDQVVDHAADRRGAGELEHHLVLVDQRSAAATRRPPGGTVHRIGDLTGPTLRGVRALRELVVALDPDVVHVHAPHTARGVRLAVGSLPRRRRPALLVDPAPFTPGPARPAPDAAIARVEARRTLGIGANAPVVATAAPFEKASRYDVWLDVAHAVCDADPHVHFVAAGHGPLEADVRARARATGHGDRIRILRSMHAAPALGAADLVLCTGEQRDRPAGLREALVLGLPVVAAATAGAHDTVHHDVDALLVAPADRTAFVTVVETLLTDAARRERLGAMAARRERDTPAGTTDDRYREVATANRAARAGAPTRSLVGAR
jgi:glycosyltransferase involved in cell wall biosynthesis